MPPRARQDAASEGSSTAKLLLDIKKKWRMEGEGRGEHSKRQAQNPREGGATDGKSLQAGLSVDPTYRCTAALQFYRHFLPATRQMSFADWIIQGSPFLGSWAGTCL